MFIVPSSDTALNTGAEADKHSSIVGIAAQSIRNTSLPLIVIVVVVIAIIAGWQSAPRRVVLLFADRFNRRIVFLQARNGQVCQGDRFIQGILRHTQSAVVRTQGRRGRGQATVLSRAFGCRYLRGSVLIVHSNSSLRETAANLNVSINRQSHFFDCHRCGPLMRSNARANNKGACDQARGMHVRAASCKLRDATAGRCELQQRRLIHRPHRACANGIFSAVIPLSAISDKNHAGKIANRPSRAASNCSSRDVAFHNIVWHEVMISAHKYSESPMIRYADLNGNSGVVAYRCGRDWMDVEFVDGEIYRYDIRSAGAAAIRQMKLLAALGSGLATYINQHAHDRYRKRLS